MLPNGDVLVVESNGPRHPVNRPKDIVMGLVKGPGRRRATPGGNRITLLRDTDGDGKPDSAPSFSTT